MKEIFKLMGAIAWILLMIYRTHCIMSRLNNDNMEQVK